MFAFENVKNMFTIRTVSNVTFYALFILSLFDSVRDPITPAGQIEYLFAANEYPIFFLPSFLCSKTDFMLGL